ncbi:peptide ABC transporter substrate-binding protein [candidate division KSB3 bacterium]|uniref:Peptide ABC transporter substrate-binding protein n=1 Tax=candidate division KSB3 bacterium TaxID=2044937 RepID=A0A9D5JT23_9BACT|nr:peptide ABC transporter substrate-binding protein [candidate division KSB3 bacterium]MBD3323539.1 peptide ABC transporter substrate-binding protein [candidate division KSB3 bacterium]
MKKFVVCLSVVLMLMMTSVSVFAAGGTVVYGTTERVTDMDPAHAYDMHTWEIFYNIYQGLLKYPAGETELVPGLAESYTVSEDGKEYTFQLREGVAFTDGTPFNADAVKWSIDRVMALQGDPSWLVTDFVEAVEVVDEYTVKFILKNAVAYFPSLVATVPYYPVNPNIYPADRIIRDPSELEGGQLVGLGPYKVISFKRDEEVVLEANPDFYGEQPKNDRVVIRYFADATTMRLALEKGEVDVVFKTLNPSDIADLQESDDLVTIKAQGPAIRYICMICDEEPFQNKVLRQAAAAAVNREEIIKKVFLGQRQALYSMVPIGMWSHIDAFKDVYGDGNIEMAKELLASQGYDENNPLEFALWYTPAHYGDMEVDMAAVLKEQFEATGVMKVEVKSAEWATYKDNWADKAMPMYLLGWYPDYIDPDNYTAAFAGTAGSQGMGIFFSDDQWDMTLTKAQIVTDSAQRTVLYELIQEMWANDVMTVPLVQETLYLFTQKNVTGVVVSPTLQFNYGPIEIQ